MFDIATVETLSLLASHRQAVSRWPLAASAMLHLLAVLLIVALAERSTTPAAMMPPRISAPIDVRHIIFIAPDNLVSGGGGGGGGGNRQSGPIRRAQGIGSDPITLRVAKPTTPIGAVVDRPSLPALVLPR